MTTTAKPRRKPRAWLQKAIGAVHKPWEKPAPEERGRHYRLAVGLIFKNEAEYLPEWLNFHLLVGVQKFFLYNNNSDDHYLEVLAPYRRAGLVTLHDVPLPPSGGLQRRTFTACVNAYRDNADWIAFLDADEFLYGTTEDSLVDILDQYREHPAVAVNWLMFATSGHIARPDGGCIANFTRCQPGGNKHVKLVVNPRRTVVFNSGHDAQYLGGALAVNEQHREVRGPHSLPPSIERLRINHYWTKSVEEFFTRKLSRGDVVKLTALRDAQGLVAAERNYSGGTDTAIQRFLPRLASFKLDAPR